MATSLITEQLVDAIAQAESNNDPAAVGDRHLKGQAHGAFQMRQIAYKDVQRIYPKEFGKIPYAQLKTDPSLQRRAARRYLDALEQTYGAVDLDHVIAAYNAGPSAATGEIPNPDYVQKVKRYLNPGGQMPRAKPQSALPQEEGDPIERGLSRMNSFLVDLGLQSMRSPEIEQILRQVTPRKAIRGIDKPSVPYEGLPFGGSRIAGEGMSAMSDSMIHNLPATGEDQSRFRNPVYPQGALGDYNLPRAI